MADTTDTRPVVLLSHGAWHRPESFRLLIDDLEKLGLTVLAPPLASSGRDDSIYDKSHVDDTKCLQEALLPLLDEGRTAVAVGHSYGNTPLYGAIKDHTVAERAGRGLRGGVLSVINIASPPLPPVGTTMFDAMGFENGAPWFHDVTEKELPLKAELAPGAFYSGYDESVQKEMSALLVPQSRAVMEVPVTVAPAEFDIPKTYIVCANDRTLPKEIQVTIAEAWGATPVMVETGHTPWLDKDARAKIVGLIVQGAGRS